MDYFGAGGVKLSGTIGTANTNVAHGLGVIPNVVFFLPIGAVAGVVRLVSKDSTNLVFISTLASTTIEAYAWP